MRDIPYVCRQERSIGNLEVQKLNVHLYLMNWSDALGRPSCGSRPVVGGRDRSLVVNDASWRLQRCWYIVEVP